MNNPNVKLKLTTVEWIVEAFAFLMIVITLWLVLQNYANLPAVIPSHFNASGTADGYGGKWTLLLLTAINVAIYGLASLAVKFPMLMNYPIPITVENNERQYLNAVKMIRAVKLITSAMFLYLVYEVINNAKGDSTGLGAWFLPIALASIFMAAGYYLYRGYKLR
jgi:uncharacterized membrane protein